jgi:hypothetical protein
MVITSLKELDKLMLLCKKRGVQSIEIDGIKFQIDITEPVKPKKVRSSIPFGPFDPAADINTPDQVNMPDELTADQLLMWSSNSQGTAE